MASKRNSMLQDPDSTIRALEGFESLHGAHSNLEHEEQNSDESDLFLRAAKEEETAQRSHMNERLVRSDRRRVSTAYTSFFLNWESTVLGIQWSGEVFHIC